MKISDIKFNDKIKAILSDDSRFTLIEGPTGTGKTFVSGLKTFFRVFNSPRGHNSYAFVAESASTVEKMLVDDPASFVNIFSSVCSFSGGSKPHIKIDSPTGIKRIYLGGFSNKSAWTKILGLNLHGIHIEELSIAHDDFIREAFTRVSRLSTKPWLLATTNGGYPDQIMYTEFFDRSYIDKILNGNIPLKTLEYMDRNQNKDKRFKYWYFGFDDSVALTKSAIQDLYNLYPVGSFYYNSKIIGQRGFATGAIYGGSLTSDLLIDNNDRRFSNIIRYNIGVDVGTSDYTVFVLIGMTVNYKEMIIIDYMKINDSGTEEIIQAFDNWFSKYHSEGISLKTHGLFFDYAGGGSVLLRSMKAHLIRKYNLQVANAHKNKIVERIEANIKLFKAKRVLFGPDAKDIYNAFAAAVYTENRNLTDPRLFSNHTNKDLVDATEYAQSPFMKLMLYKS